MAVLTFPDAQALDATGPLEVFHAADQAAGGGAYRVELIGLTTEPQPTSSGYALVPARDYRSLRRAPDTLVVVGGIGTQEVVRDRALIAWLRKMAPRSRRVVSVCTGAFLLAKAGLLDGRRATTHWGSCRALAKSFPAVDVDADPIFVKDGPIYTSAGVTAGIDLALALVEEDLGRDVALAVARRLVVFLKRPGGQSQFSASLAMQTAHRDAFRDLGAYVTEHPAADLSVEVLAERCGMSPRNFARRFTEDVGESPARFVRRMRVEVARRLLEETDDSVDSIASRTGLGSAETMRRAFSATTGLPPHDYRRRFGRKTA